MTQNFTSKLILVFAFYFTSQLDHKLNAQAPNIVLTQFSQGYNQPVGIENCGDRRLFIVCKGGTIFICDSNGNKSALPFLNITTKVNSSANEFGLLGLAFHPNYFSNGYFYVNYINMAEQTVISRFSVSPSNANRADSLSETVLFTIQQPFNNHNGGQIRFGSDGYLYIGLGDGGSSGDPGDRAQNKLNLLGKMLRINVNTVPYSIPPNNPFVNDTSYAPEIWDMGLRNPWRFSFDRRTNDLWIADVGQGLYEEVNFEPAGSAGGLNYGWRCYEGLHTYNPTNCTGNYFFPIHEYTHSGPNGCSVTGGYVYRGVNFGNLYGKYIFTDYCSGLFRMIEPAQPSGWTTTILNDFANYQQASFGEDKYGELYITHIGEGKIYKVETTSCAPKALIDGSSSHDLCSEYPIVLNALFGINVTYQWKRNGNAISGETNSTITVALPGTYTVIVTRNGGCSAESNSISIVQQNSPDASITLAGSSVLCNNQTVAINGVANPACSFQWYLNGSEIPNAVLSYINASQQGFYKLKVSKNPNCISISDSVQILTPPAPTISIFTPGTTVICNTSPVSLFANYSGSPQFQWLLNGDSIAGATHSSFNAFNAGTYSLLISETGGCSALSNSIVITQSSPPVAAIYSAQGTVLCDTNGLLLYTDTSTSYNYQWYLNGSVIPAANNFSYKALVAGNYQVRVSESGGCSTLTNALSIISSGLPSPAKITSGSLVICGSSSVLLTADSGANYIYQWYQNGTAINAANTRTYTASAAGDYNVLISNNTGCFVLSNTLSLSQQANPVASITSTGGTIICGGTGITLQASSGLNYTYQWYLNGAGISNANLSTYLALAAGSYQVRVTTPGGCSAMSGTFNLTLATQPKAVITASGPTDICLDSSVVLSANTGSGLSYQWKKNNANLPGQTGISLTADIDGDYRCVVTKPNGCNKKSNIITVTRMPVVYITPTTEFNLCPGDTVVLHANSVSGVTYKWKRDAAYISGASKSTYKAYQAGVYKVKVTQPNGCGNLSLGVKATANCRMDGTESGESFNVNLFPNPVSDILTIEINSIETTDFKIEITDVVGTNITTLNRNVFKSQEFSEELNVNTFPKGVYFVEISGMNVSRVMKFVKE